MDYLKNLRITDKKAEIEEISETASKEYGNLKTMAKMQEDWEPLEFACRAVPEKESYILDGESIELIQTILDDHIIKTQTMKGSPFAKFMLPKIETWEKMLMRT